MMIKQRRSIVVRIKISVLSHPYATAAPMQLVVVRESKKGNRPQKEAGRVRMRGSDGKTRDLE